MTVADLSLLTLLAIASAPTSAQPLPRPPGVPGSSQRGPVAPYDGRFSVGYQPIYCIRAPCPPGHYWVRMPSRPTVQVSVIEYDPASPPAARGGAASGDGVAIDGRITFVQAADGKSRKAVILSRSAAAGMWKP